MSEHIRTDTADGVLIVTLNRPEKQNALTRAMYQSLADAIAHADAGMSIEGGHFAAQLQSAEAREAFAAFAEKRAPDFSRVERA